MAIPDNSPGSTPDAVTGALDLLPASARPYARLARFDRPIGAWLLLWPCLWGLALGGGLPAQWPMALLFALGAVAMRGAGCVWNDIVDRDLDRQVARTRARPIASGAVSVRAAAVFMVLLALIGFGVLLALQPMARWVALGSLALVAAYPFMKRIHGWPQAWLGLTFNWGALVGFAQGAGELTLPALLLYAAGVCWTLGYDTIYALQDIEDDALAGVRSSARTLGRHVRAGVLAFYLLAAVLLAAALWIVTRVPFAAVAALPFAWHLLRQAARLRRDDPVQALALFRSNRDAGALAALACITVSLA